MHWLLAPLLLAAGIDGEAALRHASSLAALGPHPWGSPRAPFAAAYVEAQFREAGLQEVRQQAFERHGLRGANVIGVLRAPGREFVVVGAHHDTAPDAPGAYDDGGGVGVLIEAARVLAARGEQRRTLMFVSFDGEEAWFTGQGSTAGSRAFIEALGDETRQLVAALVIEMSGWAGGRPVFHPVPYRDPLRPGAALVTPGWLLRAAQDGARRAGAPMPVGDPLIPWLYQPAVRLFRVNLYGDDLSFAQARLPAVFVSDSSFTRFYPWYHKPADTRDKLDAGALARMGQGVLGALDALQRVERGPAQEPTWFAAFERVFDARMVLGAATLSLVPGLLVCLRLGGLALTLRLIQAAAFGSLLWRHPVPAVAVFLLPNLLTAFSTRLWTLVGLLPLVALAAIGADAWRQGAVSGIWLAPWEMIAAGSALVLLWLRPRPAGTRSRAGRLRGRASGAGRRGRSAS